MAANMTLITPKSDERHAGLVLREEPEKECGKNPIIEPKTKKND
jgi:hypothetical protein